SAKPCWPSYHTKHLFSESTESTPAAYFAVETLPLPPTMASIPDCNFFSDLPLVDLPLVEIPTPPPPLRAPEAGFSPAVITPPPNNFAPYQVGPHPGGPHPGGPVQYKQKVKRASQVSHLAALT